MTVRRQNPDQDTGERTRDPLVQGAPRLGRSKRGSCAGGGIEHQLVALYFVRFVARLKPIAVAMQALG